MRATLMLTASAFALMLGTPVLAQDVDRLVAFRPENRSSSAAAVIAEMIAERSESAAVRQRARAVAPEGAFVVGADELLVDIGAPELIGGSSSSVVPVALPATVIEPAAGPAPTVIRNEDTDRNWGVGSSSTAIADRGGTDRSGGSGGGSQGGGGSASSSGASGGGSGGSGGGGSDSGGGGGDSGGGGGDSGGGGGDSGGGGGGDSGGGGGGDSGGGGGDSGGGGGGDSGGGGGGDSGGGGGDSGGGGGGDSGGGGGGGGGWN